MCGSEPLLSITNLRHAYFGRTVLDDIDLSVGIGEVVALVGPSGCGKSTLAQIAAGLTEPLAGRIRRRYQRHAVVFQEPALLPWATAGGNIAYPLRLAHVPRRLRMDRVMETAARVSLSTTDLEKHPVELSGGMRQRVAIARALAVQPDFVFFDEPFTALDVALRRRMQDLVIAACRESGLAGLFITHDLQEAARIAHRIAVLDTNGHGVLGHRRLSGTPGERSDGDVQTWVLEAIRTDPIFRHIHDVDERRLA